MPFVPTTRRFEQLEDNPGPQKPFKALLMALITGELTETNQNMATTDSAGINYGYLPSPQGYAAASSFNAALPVQPAAPATLPATVHRNSIEDL